ncbi:MAG: hypothetical protein R6X33_14210 [Candidatus Brocadiia bacterium]
MAELMIGTSAYPSADRELLREAGIEWLRQSFPFPFRDHVGGELTDDYVERRARVEELTGDGFRILGVTPRPGIATRERDEQGRLEWRRWNPGMPEWCGELGTPEFARTYRRTCEWLADDVAGLVPVWQVANELDISPFAWNMNPRQSCDLIAAGARGLKETDDSLTVGFNLTAGRGKTYYFFGYFYGRQDGLLDYCGLDGYYGTWQSGGPESWAERIDEVYALTGTPLLINEWGFSSAGGVTTEEEAEEGLSTCQTHKWRNTWGPGHNPDGQAAFVRQTFDVFAERRDKLLGLFFYRWEDQDECWQCGDPDCPAETAWGLVDREGAPKPAYHAFKDGTARLTAN